MVEIEKIYEYVQYAVYAFGILLILAILFKAGQKTYQMLGYGYFFGILLNLAFVGHAANEIRLGRMGLNDAVQAVINLVSILGFFALLIFALLRERWRCQELFPGEEYSQELCRGLGSRRAENYKMAYPSTQPKQIARRNLEMASALDQKRSFDRTRQYQDFKTFDRLRRR